LKRSARDALPDAFPETDGLALRHPLFGLRSRFPRRPGIVGVKLSVPNKRHFLVDMAPFALDNPNEVYYYASDHPVRPDRGHRAPQRGRVPEEVVWSF
jgi:urate oxidase